MVSAFDYAGSTVISGKLEQYRNEDGDFLAIGTAAAERAYGANLPEVLPRLAMFVIHAETIAARKAETVLSFLRRQGFALLLARPFEISMPMCETVWRFQANVQTPDSMAIRDAIYTHGTSIMLLLRDTRPYAGRPASSRLTLLKGSPDPRNRDGDSLRSELGAINNIFGFVHCADEPLDVLRELAIMMPEPALSDLHSHLARTFADDTEYDCRSVVESVYAESPEHDIDSARALRRLLAAVAEVDGGGARAQTLRASLVERDQNLDWFVFSKELRELGIDPLGWDPLIVAGDRVPYDVPGRVKLIPSFTELVRSKGELRYA